MIWVSMVFFFAAVSLLFYAIRIYGAGDMSHDRAARLVLASAVLTAASFTLLLVYTFKEFAS